MGNVFVKISDLEVLTDVPTIAPWKRLQLSHAHKVEVGLKFGWPTAQITKEDITIPKTGYLSIVHLEMCEWLSRRDCGADDKMANRKIAQPCPKDRPYVGQIVQRWTILARAQR